MTRFVKDAIAALGYDVQLNRPYAGGYITEHYGRPSRGMQAIQLEINRGLYLDEATLRPTNRFATLKKNLTTLATRLFVEVPALFERRAAAE